MIQNLVPPTQSPALVCARASARSVAKVLLGLLCVAAIGACDNKPAPEPPAVQSPDDGLKPVKLEEVPSASRRLVILAPNLTEIVFALGAGDRVIGVSDYATYPPEVEDLPRVGGLLNPNLERVLELKPDLVLLHASNKELAFRLRKLGLQPRMFSADSVEQIYKVILRVGQAIGADLDAGALVTGMKRELLEVAAPKDAPRVKVLLVVGRSDGTLQGLRSAGPGSFLHELVELAGGENIAAGTGKAWPELSKEALVAAAPDVIIEFAPGAKDDDAKALLPWGALPNVPAVKNGRIHRLKDDHLLIPGPRIVTTARDIRSVLDDARPTGEP